MIVQSAVKAVTVYTDRAEVVRTMKVKAGKGDQVFQFDMLPDGIDENSIRVRGGKKALLKDVKLKRVFFDDIPNVDVKALYGEKKKTTEAIEDIDDRIDHCRKERTFVESIAAKLTGSAEKTMQYEYDPDKWIKLVDFYRARLDTLDAGIRAAEREKIPLKDKLTRIGNEISGVENVNRRSRNQAEVSVLVEEDGDIELDLVYLVYGPSWQPLYDLRVASDAGKLDLTYHAVIRQCTGEDWENVALRLSTARPNIGGRQPELTPWRLSFYRPAPPRMARMASGATMRVEMPAAAPAMNQMFEPAEEKAAEPQPEAMESMASTVEGGATAVVFAVEGTSVIKSDNEPHRVTILSKSFPATFRYSSVPKLSAYAYLKAKVKNDTEYPLLPGPSNIFLDDNFVSRAGLDFVAPGEEFWTYLGVDESMKITYSFLGRYELTEGMFGKMTKIQYKWLITVKNNRRTAEELVVWDQVPVPQNEEIVVKLTEPEYKKDTDALKMNADKYLEWFFKPQPGEEIKVPLTFTVEFPKGSTVVGLP